MAVLELLLQANRLNEDAERAKMALEGIKTSAVGAETAVAGAGKSMSIAFSAAGNAQQLAGGVTQISQALQTANVAAAALGTSRFITDLGQTASQFGQLAVTAGTAGRALSSIGGFIARISPWAAIAAAITSVASAMGAFGAATKNAGEQIDVAKQKADQFRSSLSGIAGAAAAGQSLAGSVRQFLAQGDASRNLANLRFGAVSSLRPQEGLLFSGRTGSDPDFSREFVSLASLRSLIPLIDNEAGEGLLRTRRGRLSGGLNEEDLVERGEFDRYLRERLRRGGFDEGFQTTLSPAATITAAGGGIRQGGTTDDEFLAQARIGYSQDQSEQAAARLRDMVESARQVGAYLGDAFFDALTGAQSVRQVLGSIVSDFARQGLRNIVSSIAGSIAGGFGQTTAQTRTVGEG